jgi:hypothetical protein
MFDDDFSMMVMVMVMPVPVVPMMPFVRFNHGSFHRVSFHRRRKIIEDECQQDEHVQIFHGV